MELCRGLLPPAGVAWRQCALVPSIALAHCGRIFRDRKRPAGFSSGGGPSQAIVRALHTVVEALVFSELVAVKVPTRYEADPGGFLSAEAPWLVPAQDAIVLVGLDGKQLGHVAREVERMLDAFGPAEKPTSPTGWILLDFFETFDALSDGAMEKAKLDLICGDWFRFTVSGPFSDVQEPVKVRGDDLQDVRRRLELFDLAVARLMCDEKRMTLWAVPGSIEHRVCCVAHAPHSSAAVLQLRQQIADMRQQVLRPGTPAFQAAGTDIYCNVEMSPVLLALARQASDGQDLIRLAVQLRSAAAPFRKHLALLDEIEGGDLLQLVDWRYELQRVCDAVGRALGLRGTHAGGSVGTAVVQAAGGNPIEVVNMLAERAPSSVRRHLLHPLYLTRKQAFLRDLVYDAVLGPELDRRLSELLG